ncbi:unnamed protein product, partial [Didymodactylos carnosus]
GLLYGVMDEYDLAIDYLIKAQDMFEKTEHYQQQTSSLAKIGIIYEENKDYDRALNYYRQQYELNEKYIPTNNQELITNFNWIIDVYKKNDDYDSALDYCRENLTNIPEGNHLRSGHILKAIAHLLLIKDEREQAWQYYQKALVSFEKCHPSENLAMIDCLKMLSAFYADECQFDQALAKRKKLLNLQKQIYPLSLDLAFSYRFIGEIYFEMKMYTDALYYFTKALKLYETFDEQQDTIGEIQINIAYLTRQQTSQGSFEDLSSTELIIAQSSDEGISGHHLKNLTKSKHKQFFKKFFYK